MTNANNNLIRNLQAANQRINADMPPDETLSQARQAGTDIGQALNLGHDSRDVLSMVQLLTGVQDGLLQTTVEAAADLMPGVAVYRHGPEGDLEVETTDEAYYTRSTLWAQYQVDPESLMASLTHDDTADQATYVQIEQTLRLIDQLMRSADRTSVRPNKVTTLTV